MKLEIGVANLEKDRECFIPGVRTAHAVFTRMYRETTHLEGSIPFEKLASVQSRPVLHRHIDQGTVVRLAHIIVRFGSLTSPCLVLFSCIHCKPSSNAVYEDRSPGPGNCQDRLLISAYPGHGHCKSQRWTHCSTQPREASSPKIAELQD
jgi:hypothetical protein